MPEIVGGNELIIQPDTPEAIHSVLEAAAKVVGITGGVPESLAKDIHFRYCPDWGVPTIVVTSGEKILFAPPFAGVNRELTNMRSDVRLEIGRAIENDDVRVGVNDEIFGKRGKEYRMGDYEGEKLARARNYARALMIRIAYFREIQDFAWKNQAGPERVTPTSGESLVRYFTNTGVFQDEYKDRLDRACNGRDYLEILNDLICFAIRCVEDSLRSKNKLDRFKREHPEFSDDLL